MLEDNTAAIRLAVDESAAHRTRHIELKYHHVREMVMRKAVEVVHVCTEEQHADVLTKALPVVQHHYHAGVLLGTV
jgi:transcription initiation factor IIE alpha subunit